MQHGILWLALLICTTIVVTAGTGTNFTTWYTADWYDNSECDGIPVFTMSSRHPFEEFDDTFSSNCTLAWGETYIILTNLSTVPERNESDWHAFYYSDDNVTVSQHIWGLWGCVSISPTVTVTAHANATYATMIMNEYADDATCDSDEDPIDISNMYLPVGDTASPEGNIVILVEDTYTPTTSAGTTLVVSVLLSLISIIGL